MPQIPCPVSWCDRAMPGHRNACAACEARLVRDLAQVPSLAAELEVTLTRQARIVRLGGRTVAVDDEGGIMLRRTPLAYDPAAREALDKLRTTLVRWARALQARGTVQDAPGALTLTAVSAWLRRHHGALLGHASAPAVVENVTRVMAAARHAIDRPADYIYAGPCSACDGDLYARPGASMVACQWCRDDDGHRLRYGVAERREWMLAAVEEMCLPAADIARALTSLLRPIRPELLYTWVNRRRLFPVGLNARDQMLFRVGDVIGLMRPREREPERMSV